MVPGKVSSDDRISGWSGRSVLVTGSTGFAGCWLSRRLFDLGAQVVGVARNRITGPSLFDLFGLRHQVRVVYGQMEDYELLEQLIDEQRIEAVFHLAAESDVASARRQPRLTFESTIRGTWNLLEAVRMAQRPIRVVLASSGTVYGDSGNAPFAEDLELRGKSPYDISKICAELLCRSYRHSYGIAVSIARCSNIYGGGDLNFNRIIPGTVRSVLQGEAPAIKSRCEISRDFLYVEDATTAYLTLAEAMTQPGIAGEAFNFGRGESVSLLEVVQTILRLMDRRDLPPRILGQAGDETPRTSLSLSKARKALGWSANTSLEVGLMRTVAWYRDNWTAVCRMTNRDEISVR